MRQSIKQWILCFLLPLSLFAALSLSSCGQKKEPVVQSGFYFDTVVSITLYGESDSLSPLFEEVFALCAHYESMLSRTAADSDIAKINEAAGTPVSVRPETLSLLQTACSYAELTGGLVDPTVTPLVLLWGFGNTPESAPDTTPDSAADDTPASAADNTPGSAADNASSSAADGTSASAADNASSSAADGAVHPALGSAANPADASSLTIPPNADALAEACSHIDYHSIIIDEQAGTVMLTDPDAAIDLGFIAKGYIADRIRDYLISQEVKSAIINLGGNVLCIGEKPDHSPYRVAVKYPFGGAEDIITTIPVRGQSVVTSGVYERFIELDGVQYHHILDPRTGYPVENGLLSVTIVTNSSTDADALSTACFLLGLTDGMALIESLDDTEALFITEDYTLHYSSGLLENR